MITAIIVLLSVAVVGIGVLVIHALWPRRVPCPFAVRSCAPECPFFSRKHERCALNLAVRVYLDRRGGNAGWLAEEMDKVEAKDAEQAAE